MIEIFNNSMFETWTTCEKKFFLKYIKSIKIPQDDTFFELGKKVHAMINYKLQGFDMLLMEKASDDITLTHYNSILKHELLKQKVLLTEWGFLCNIADTQNLLAGRIDAVFFDEKENIYTIADWKTGMSIPKSPIESPQALIYMYSLYKAQNDLNLIIKPEQIRFIFIQTPSLNESEIWFSEELKNKIENDFLLMIKNMKKTTFKETEKHEQCKLCEYNFVCSKNQFPVLQA